MPISNSSGEIIYNGITLAGLLTEIKNNEIPETHLDLNSIYNMKVKKGSNPIIILEKV